MGVSIGTSGFGVTVVGSVGRGKADGSDVTWTNTHIEAGDQINIQSGADTNLIGAVAKADQVTADVGGNLDIESLQDVSSYDSKQKSVGGSLTVGVGGITGGSVSYNGSKINSDYASVTEQSGIRAGDGGFQVDVKGNTGLKGGAITSTQKAIDNDRNTFNTDGTLTLSDIQNKASYEGKAAGVNLGAVPSVDGSLTPGSSSAGTGHDSGSDSSMTLAAISGIAGNTEARTGDAETGLDRIFDAEKVQKNIDAQVKITQKLSEQANEAVNSYVTEKRADLQKQFADAETPEEKEAIQSQIRELNNEERVMNVLIGLVTGQPGSAAGKEVLSAAAEEMRRITIEDSLKFKGVKDGTTTLLTNLSGESEGVRGDNVKAGGERVNLDKLCGEGNKNCETKPDENGNMVLVWEDGMVLWNRKKAGMTMAAFLDSDKGKDIYAPAGGIQGWKGTLFGIPYKAGSLADKLVESFSGSHDVIGGTLVGLYDEQGNIKRGLSPIGEKIYDTWSAAAIVPSAPFAMSELLPPEVWQAISAILQVAK